MKKQGKFILFENINEFKDWLNKTNFTRKIKLIQIHHTWSPSYKDFKNKNHFKLLTSMEEAHLERGFAEIAQNITVFPDNTLAICRSFNTIPAGIKGCNSNGLCVEILGNFDVNKDKMNDEQKKYIVQIIALLCKEFNLNPSIDSIGYHHWYDLNTGLRVKEGNGVTKTCPGSNWFNEGNTIFDAEHGFVSVIKSELLKL